MKQESSGMGSVPLRSETPKSLLTLPPCEDTVRRQQSMKQEAGLHLSTLDFQPLDLEK